MFSVCAFFCVCVQVEALRRADHPLKESYRLSTIQKKKTEVKRRVSWRQAKAQIGAVEPMKKKVGIATGYGLDGQGFDSRQGQDFFAHSVQTASGAHPSYPNGTGSSFLGVKAAEE
jgi:hypothetical protein